MKTQALVLSRRKGQEDRVTVVTTDRNDNTMRRVLRSLQKNVLAEKKKRMRAIKRVMPDSNGFTEQQILQLFNKLPTTAIKCLSKDAVLALQFEFDTASATTKQAANGVLFPVCVF